MTLRFSPDATFPNQGPLFDEKRHVLLSRYRDILDEYPVPEITGINARCDYSVGKTPALLKVLQRRQHDLSTSL